MSISLFCVVFFLEKSKKVAEKTTKRHKQQRNDFTNYEANCHTYQPVDKDHIRQQRQVIDHLHPQRVETTGVDYIPCNVFVAFYAFLAQEMTLSIVFNSG